VGGRLDWYDYTDAQPRWNLTNHYEVHHHLTKYAGLIYDLDNHHSVYVSYTDIFKPQNYYDVDHKLLSPVVGKNYEIGIKGAYFDNTLNISLALFRMDQENRAARISDQTQCSTYPTATCYEAAGLVRAEGIDFEIDGAITPDWQITAGYSHTLAKYRKDADATKIGTLFDTDVPRHMVKVLTNYPLPGNLDSIRIGGSFYWQSTIYNNGVTSGIAYHEEQKSYALVGLNASYQITENFDVRFNINNLFDKKYFRSLTGQSGLAFPTSVYGDPRNAMLTARYRF
jgi:outer membrane receptor for ferric coprogen and ferric-rhodotorulic acid